MLINKQRFYRAFIFLAMLCLALCGCIAMIENDGDSEVAHSAFYYFLTFVALLPSLVVYFNSRLHHQQIPSFIKWFAVLIMWMTITSIIWGMSNLRATVFICLRTLIAFEALCMMYVYSRTYGEDKKIYWMAIGMQVIFILQYIRIYSIANLVSEAHLITSYYSLFMLPLVLMYPSRIIKSASILIVTLAIFASVKRGGIIALTLGLIVYLICFRRIQSKEIKVYVYTLVALCSLGIVFYYISMSEFGGVIERIASIGDDGGSGRTDVWATTWDMILQSNFIHFLLGHGSNAVLQNSPLDLSAHNDLLEAWYDYGFIGFLLYLFTLVSLGLYSLRLLQNKSSHAPSMIMMLTIMVILTMISHVLIYYFLTLCCLTYGLITGQEYYNEHHQ